MKQTLFMIVLTMVGSLGVFVSPFYAVAIYYLNAVLRPQYLWRWAMPRGIPWSEFVAVPAIVCAILVAMGSRSPVAADPGPKARFTRTHITFLLFAVWVTASYLTARNRSVAYPWMLEYLKIFTMFVVSAVLITRLEQLWALMLIAAAALGYIAYEVNLMYFSVGYLGIYHNGYGGLDNNGAGLMLAMGVPLCLFIYMGTRRWWRWPFAIFIPLLVHSVMMTYSRGAMLALLLTTPVMLFRSKYRAQMALASVALAIAVPVLAGAEIRHEFFSIESYERDGSAKSRFDSWQAGLEIAADYPIFGVGVRNSNLLSQQYGADNFGRTIHNQFIQIMADSGIPALVFYLLTIAFIVIGLRRVRHWARHEATDQANMAYSLACGVEGSLTVFCVGSTFLSLEVFELPYLVLLIGAQLPIVLGLTERSVTPIPTLQAPRYGVPPASANPARVGM